MIQILLLCLHLSTMLAPVISSLDEIYCTYAVLTQQRHLNGNHDNSVFFSLTRTHLDIQTPMATARQMATPIGAKMAAMMPTWPRARLPPNGQPSGDEFTSEVEACCTFGKRRDTLRPPVPISPP